MPIAVDIRQYTGPQKQNILITCDGRVKILDFGLAKIVTAANTDADATRAMTRTQAGATLGTTAYMSPEQARGVWISPRNRTSSRLDWS